MHNSKCTFEKEKLSREVDPIESACIEKKSLETRPNPVIFILSFGSFHKSKEIEKLTLSGCEHI